MGAEIESVRTLAGGYSHETSLLALSTGPVVVRLGGGDPHREAAVMGRARSHVPTPRVLLVDEGFSTRAPSMVLEFVDGTPLSEVLLAQRAGLGQLGQVVAATAVGIGRVEFERPGFFAGPLLDVAAELPWSGQLGPFAESCMERTPADRLSAAERRAWAGLCAAAAPVLQAVDTCARLVHADFNPKNLLVSQGLDGWRVDAVLDWEFSYAGCPYGDAANMLRFADDYPADFVDGFRSGYGAAQPARPDWEQIGRVLDMFALSDLVGRPSGHVVADRAAVEVRRRIAAGQSW
jgi:Ser/Thr protein kinase RdoA (MazF antagonist)